MSTQDPYGDPYASAIDYTESDTVRSDSGLAGYQDIEPGDHLLVTTSVTVETVSKTTQGVTQSWLKGQVGVVSLSSPGSGATLTFFGLLRGTELDRAGRMMLAIARRCNCLLPAEKTPIVWAAPPDQHTAPDGQAVQLHSLLGALMIGRPFFATLQHSWKKGDIVDGEPREGAKPDGVKIDSVEVIHSIPSDVWAAVLARKGAKPPETEQDATDQAVYEAWAGLMAPGDKPGVPFSLAVQCIAHMNGTGLRDRIVPVCFAGLRRVWAPDWVAAAERALGDA